jgi:hypothetical protein
MHLGIRDVELHGLGRTALRAKAGDERLEAVEAVSAENDVVAVGGEPCGRGRSDAAARSGDERDLG